MHFKKRTCFCHIIHLYLEKTGCKKKNRKQDQQNKMNTLAATQTESTCWFRAFDFVASRNKRKKDQPGSSRESHHSPHVGRLPIVQTSSCSTLRNRHVLRCFTKELRETPGLPGEICDNTSSKHDRLYLQSLSTEASLIPFLPSPLSSQEKRDV